MKTCKDCSKEYEPRVLHNGIKQSRCDNCTVLKARNDQRRHMEKQLNKPKAVPRRMTPKRKKLRDVADQVFSVYIRKRDNGRCFTCGAVGDWKNMQNGHYLSRRHAATRFDEVNCNCQCIECNELHGGALQTYRERLIEKHGLDVVEDLEKRSRTVFFATDEYYKEIIAKYG